MSDEERPPEPLEPSSPKELRPHLGPREPDRRPSKPSELEPTIVRRAIFEGSQEAFVLFYRHHQAIVRYAISRAATKAGWCDDMEGLVQDIWCRFLDNDRRILSYYDEDRGKISSFVRCVAYQQAYYLLQRRRKKHPPSGDLPPEDRLRDERALRDLSALIQSDFCQKLLAGVEADLTHEDRALLHEHLVGDKALRELAKLLGTSENALSQRKRRLKQKLRQIAERLQKHTKRRPPPSGGAPPDTLVAILMIWLFASGAETPLIAGQTASAELVSGSQGE